MQGWFKYLTICFLSVLCSHAYANENDNNAWFMFATSGKINADSKLLYWFDGHARFGDDARHLRTSIIRPGIGWQYSDALKLFVGYARVTGHRNGNPDIDEDRIWQQALYKIAPFAGGNWSGRTRLEQRFRNDLGDDTGHRIRQFVRWGKPLKDSKLAMVFWDEVFIGLNDTDWGQKSGFDQNRAFFGLGYAFGKTALGQKGRVEIGYMNNVINRHGIDNLTNHVLSSNLFWTF